MQDLSAHRKDANRIVQFALKAVDPARAVAQNIKFDGAALTILDTAVNITDRSIYVVGLGKAATRMALGLERCIPDLISGGVISDSSTSTSLSPRWQTFAGGHPLPNDESLAAAKAAFTLLRKADEEKAVVIFLVSGGGSAMMEFPTSIEISVEDLRRANQILVTCGATIKEINSVRCRFSTVKCGQLAAHVQNAKMITLIVSDTNAGDVAAVASGPTLKRTSEPWQEVVERYRLDQALPGSIVKALHDDKETISSPPEHPHYVILDNKTALVSAAQLARDLGFDVIMLDDVVEQEIDEGIELLLDRLKEISSRKCCLISGGEFRCPVRGAGMGGRNIETALRAAVKMAQAPNDFSQTVMVSVGSDGIDGNSPAAGAIADVNTVTRAREQGLDCNDFLARSDSYHLFQKLDDLIVTGPTGTNVRDVRILLRNDIS